MTLLLRSVLVSCLAALVVAGGCGGGSAWRKHDGSVRGPGEGEGEVDGRAPAEVLVRSELVPREPAAKRYNDPATPAPSSVLSDRLVGLVHEISRRAGQPLPLADGRLFDVAGTVASLSTGDAPLPYAAVEFALSHRGIVEPTPHLIVVRAADGDDEGVAAELGGRLPSIIAASRFARVGVGVHPAGDGTMVVVLALQESYVVTAPIPRSVPTGASVRVRGRLLEPFQKPEVFVTGTDGNVQLVPLVREAAKSGEVAFRAEVRCARVGRQQVEITGHDARGSSVLANFPLWCGEEPPTTFPLVRATAEAAVTDPRVAERRIFELLNKARQAAGLSRLAWDERAAVVSRAHSQDMLDQGFVGHVSPTTGSAADRVTRAGIKTPLVLENIARAYSPTEAHEGLMNSPGHRANILAPQATHVGIGVVAGRVVAGRPELYVTQVYLRTPARLDVKQARETARKAIAARRVEKRLVALAKDDGLEQVAQEYASALASGQEPAAAAARTDRLLDAFGARYSAILTVSALVGDAGEAASDSVLDAGARAYGLGLAQPPEGGALYVIILLGRAR